MTARRLAWTFLAAIALLMAGFLFFRERSRVVSVRKGSRVKLHYTLKVDGKVLESSDAVGPVEFVSGAGQVVPGLDEGVLGLGPGQEKTVTVPPEKGYGRVNAAAVQKVPLATFSSQPVALKEGMRVSGRLGRRMVEGRVIRVDGPDVTLDFNHPLAGKTLEFTVRIVSVEGP